VSGLRLVSLYSVPIRPELNGNVDSENNHGSPQGHMYYIGLDVHRKTIPPFPGPSSQVVRVMQNLSS
jgi:hypothetical protein